MTQAMIVQQSPGALQELERLQSMAADLSVTTREQEVRLQQIERQRAEAKPSERALYEKQRADVQHDLNVSQGRLAVINSQINDLHTRDMLLGHEGEQVFTVSPPRDPFEQAQLRGIEIGGFVLMIPIVLAFARRIWVRSGPRIASVDFDSSPRLQRMEQAIESIAIEVERIGEAQRFTTKVLTERAADPVAPRIPPAQAARREPGTITPH